MGFRPVPAERIEGRFGHVVCGCTLTTSSSNWNLVTVCLFSSLLIEVTIEVDVFSGEWIETDWMEGLTWTSKPVKLCSWTVYFLDLCDFLALWKKSHSEIVGIFRRTPGRNGVKLGILMYPDHLRNWLHFVNELLIFLIFVVPVQWLRAYLTGRRRVRGTIAIRSLDLNFYQHYLMAITPKTTCRGTT